MDSDAAILPHAIVVVTATGVVVVSPFVDYGAAWAYAQDNDMLGAIIVPVMSPQE